MKKEQEKKERESLLVRNGSEARAGRCAGKGDGAQVGGDRGRVRENKGFSPLLNQAAESLPGMERFRVIQILLTWPEALGSSWQVLPCLCWVEVWSGKCCFCLSALSVAGLALASLHWPPGPVEAADPRL